MHSQSPRRAPSTATFPWSVRAAPIHQVAAFLPEARLMTSPSLGSLHFTRPGRRWTATRAS